MFCVDMDSVSRAAVDGSGKVKAIRKQQLKYWGDIDHAVDGVNKKIVNIREYQ